jgi:hypothetical protein
VVEYLLAEGPVEASDVDVLVRLARLDVLERHALPLRRLEERLAEELRAVVGAQHQRQPRFCCSCSKTRTRRVDVIDASTSLGPPIATRFEPMQHSPRMIGDGIALNTKTDAQAFALEA